jgi:hypothetical protein
MFAAPALKAENIPKNQNRAPPRWAERWGTLHLAALGCANACHPTRWWNFRCTPRRTLHRHTAQPCHEDSTPRLNPLPSGAGSVPASRSQPDLTDIKAHTGAAFLWGCRVGHRSIRVSSTPASLACRESWRGYGCASGFMAATVRPEQFPRRCTPSSRSKFFGTPGPPRFCGRYAVRPARPSPDGSPTRTRWARSCNPERKLHHG